MNTQNQTPTQVKPLFELGQVVATSGVIDTIAAADVAVALKRYHTGDWGDVPAADARANQRALKHKERLMGVYYDSNHTKFWIITEWDRSVTTILLPDEY